jgi:geranylgeranylglycerol-phosphate geranylgeranyltransferase
MPTVFTPHYFSPFHKTFVLSCLNPATIEPDMVMTFQQKSRAMVQLIRPELPAAAGLCVVVGQSIALGALPPLQWMISGFGLGFFLSGSAMVFNDYFDLEVDRVNAPHRPLPAGLLSQNEAVVFGLLMGAAGLSIALALHAVLFVLSLIAWILGFLYNWRLKAAGLWGNLLVSTNVAMTFLLGGVSVGQISNPMLWLFSLIAFLFDLGEEIAGDAMDMAGDQKRASKSIALTYGKQTALRVSLVLFAVMILLTLVPIVWGSSGLGYRIPILLMDALIIFFAAKLYRSRTSREGHQSMRGLYISASLCLVAFVAGTFIP